MKTLSRILPLLLLLVSAAYLPGCSDDPPTNTDNNRNPHDSDTVATTKPSVSITLADGSIWKLASAPTALYDTITKMLDLMITIDSPLVDGKKTIILFNYHLDTLSDYTNVGKPEVYPSGIYIYKGNTYYVSATWQYPKQYFRIHGLNTASRTLSLEIESPAEASTLGDTMHISLKLINIPYRIVPSGRPSIECIAGDTLWMTKPSYGLEKDESFVFYQDHRDGLYVVDYHQPSPVPGKQNKIDFHFYPIEGVVGTYPLSTYPYTPAPGVAIEFMHLYHPAINPKAQDLLFQPETPTSATAKITRFDPITREMDAVIEGELFENYTFKRVHFKTTIKNKRWFYY